MGTVSIIEITEIVPASSPVWVGARDTPLAHARTDRSYVKEEYLFAFEKFNLSRIERAPSPDPTLPVTNLSEATHVAQSTTISIAMLTQILIDIRVLILAINYFTFFIYIKK